MTKLKTFAFLVLGCSVFAGSAQAQMRAQYFSPENLVAPDKLASPGAKVPAQKSVFYIRESGFGFESMDAEKTRIKVPVGFAGKVFVKFESELVNQAVNAALTAKGIKLAASAEESDVAITGQGVYRVHLMPYLQRQIRLNASFDQFKKSASITTAETKKIGVGDALLTGGTTAASAGLGSAAFLGWLIESTMDLTGATLAMEKATGWNERQRGEQSITFGDCYDNTTRAATCPPGAPRNNAYTFRTRFQYVDFKTAVSVKGGESQKFNLIARAIDGRNETKDDMNELLSMAINELIAGFPTTVPDAVKVDANDPAK